MYLYRYSMTKLPFGLTPDTDFFCALEPHIEALNVVNFALNSGEALIKVVGEVGTGKTLLCRLLLNQLEGDGKNNQRFVAYIPYPKLTAKELKFSLARELGVRLSAQSREDQLAQRIQTRLINLNKKHGPVVLIIDEAQLLDDEGLESLRLLTNLETEQQKLIQLVLLGQPELDTKLAKPHLRQIKQRIVFSYELTKLNYIQIISYVNQRLSVVSNRKIKFNWLSCLAIKHYSKGIPRLINILCHKSLMLGYGKNEEKISILNIVRSAKDTESVNTWIQDHFKKLLAIVGLLMSGSAMAFFVYEAGLVSGVIS
jgi:MSHA biogenesis protein MshM